MRWWAIAGALTGLSNLARPMTLLAIPFPILVGFCFNRFRFVAPTIAFAMALCITIAPWMLTQYHRSGIFSISSNTESSPLRGNEPQIQTIWTPAVQHDAIAAGLITADASLKDWDDFFKRGIIQNLRDDPTFWPINTMKALWASFNDEGLWLQQPKALAIALAIVWMVCGVMCAGAAGTSPARTVAIMSCLVLMLAAGTTGLLVFLLAAGVVFAAAFSFQWSMLLAAYLAGSLLAHSIFGFSSNIDRLKIHVWPDRARDFRQPGSPRSGMPPVKLPRDGCRHCARAIAGAAWRRSCRLRFGRDASVLRSRRCFSSHWADFGFTYLSRSTFYTNYAVTEADLQRVRSALATQRPDFGRIGPRRCQNAAQRDYRA